VEEDCKRLKVLEEERTILRDSYSHKTQTGAMGGLDIWVPFSQKRLICENQ
jgi:hypothetical protein